METAIMAGPADDALKKWESLAICGVHSETGHSPSPQFNTCGVLRTTIPSWLFISQLDFFSVFLSLILFLLSPSSILISLLTILLYYFPLIFLLWKNFPRGGGRDAGKVAQSLRIYIILAEDWNSVPNTYVWVTHNL